jgi:3-hydroxyacyl-CoA dehydrogenase
VFTIETVAVLGASDGGTACAVLSALAGCAVRFHGRSDRTVAATCEAVRRRVDLAFAQGAITRTEQQRILDGVLFTTDLDEALTGADLVIDASEAPATDVLDRLAGSLRATTAIAAAGATPAAELAARVPQPGCVLALRLADSGGPVPRLEVVAASTTSAHVLEHARAFASRVNGAARTGPSQAPRGAP